MADEKKNDQVVEQNKEAAPTQASPSPAPAKKKGDKKKIIIIVIAVILVIGIAGIAMNNNKSSDNGSSSSDSSSATAQASKNQKYTVTIDDAKVTKEYGKDYVVVTFTFTNNSSEETMIGTAITPSVYQNGVELSLGYTSDSDSTTTLNKVQPGATATFSRAYQLNDTTSDVQVKVTEWAYKGDVLAEKTFNIG